MYLPREDSFLILKHAKDYVRPKCKVLDMGAGSGILAEEAAKYSDDVTAADIDKELILRLKKENKHVRFVVSDLFSNIGGKFDLIMFNPPYLLSKKIEDAEVDGGKNGTKIIEKFLKEARKFLKSDGKILLICSSLNKNIEKLFKKYGYKFKLIDKENFFFEKIYLRELG